MKWAFTASLQIIGIILWSLLSACTNQPSYTVSHYEATFAPLPSLEGTAQDVAVTLFIRYNITRGPKSEGFKYIGETPVKDVRVTDGGGNALSFEVSKEDEYKISWSFSPVMQGEQEVIISFTLPAAFSATQPWHVEWVKNWRIPVADVTYRLLLPEDSAHQNWQSTSPGTLVLYEGQQALEVHLDRLSGETFTVAVK